MLEALTDRIYEAAVIPERWQGVLDDLAEFSGSMSGAMLVIDPHLPPLWAATQNVHGQLSAFAQTPGWYANPRLNRMLRRNYQGFVRDIDFSTPEELASDAHAAFLETLGVAWQSGTVVVMPTGETVLFTIERAVGQDNYDRTMLGMLDQVRPHLARASLLGARLQLKHDMDSVQTLQKVGLPAAVVSSSGMVLASNDLFETRAGFLRPAAFGRLSIADRHANGLLQAALGHWSGAEVAVRSVPVRLSEPDPIAAVVHVMPLRRGAQDLFSGGRCLVVVTAYDREGRVPPDAILRGLFDLSAAEAALAQALASGHVLKDIAADRSISLATARTQLAQVFHKTGTHQQSELVALLKSAHPLD